MPVNKAFSYFWDENKIIEKEKLCGKIDKWSFR